MPRHTPRAENDTGQDSFLDVVTNIVGILIILVMVIGARVQQLVFDLPAEAAPQAEEVALLARTVASAEQELAGLDEQIATVQATASAASMGRVQLATALSALERERDQLAAEVDASRAEAAAATSARRRLEEEIEQTRLAADAAYAEPETEEVLAFPTPIGRTVNGDEIHFQLQGGTIAYIPLEELFVLARNKTRRNNGPISQLANHVESVGPTEGFSLDYVIEAQVDRARGQVLVRSREWVVRPQQKALGEPLTVALADGSAFRRKLSRITPETTVTLWCYPDSFEAFRELRAELHRLRIPAAGRPLPEGAPIGGSADGSNSVAQ